MADPQSSQPLPVEAQGQANEDARIEHLLVAGLDQYFRGDFESAINLWTRVLFLDRHHDRARAYIERARSAQSERQRQTEAMVHQGLDAFDRGDVEQARALLSDALEQGASHDLALGVLGRIERLEMGGGRAVATSSGSRRARGLTAGRSSSAAPTPVALPTRFWVVNLLLLAVLGGASWWVWTTNNWQTLWPVQAGAARMSAIPEVNATLPVPSVSETYMRRGRDLFESGRLRDAMLEFERVPAGDPLRAAADDMRAHIQRELLALALAETAGSPPPIPAAPRPE